MQPNGTSTIRVPSRAHSHDHINSSFLLSRVDTPMYKNNNTPSSINNDTVHARICPTQLEVGKSSSRSTLGVPSGAHSPAHVTPSFPPTQVDTHTHKKRRLPPSSISGDGIRLTPLKAGETSSRPQSNICSGQYLLTRGFGSRNVYYHSGASTFVDSNQACSRDAISSQTMRKSPEFNEPDPTFSRDVNPSSQQCNFTQDQDLEIIPKGAGSSTMRKKSSTKKRGRNKCKALSKLKPGLKLPVVIYNNRVVGNTIFSRNMGNIVRNSKLCPVQVHSWKEIGEDEKEHMWEVVKEHFTHDNMESYRVNILNHMNELWNKWRADLYCHRVIKKQKDVPITTLLRQALGHVPDRLQREDWEWLIKEHYSSKKFQASSKRNSRNRSFYDNSLLYRTGSKPYREVIYNDLGGKDGKNPNLGVVFYATHKKSGIEDLVNVETSQRYVWKFVLDQF